MPSGVIVGALMTTKGPSARTEWAWISRAVSSLPEPAGPEINTRELAGPTRSMMRRRLVDHGGGADQPVDRAGARAQVADLALEPRGLQRALCDQDQAIGLERLFDEVIGARA